MDWHVNGMRCNGHTKQMKNICQSFSTAHAWRVRFFCVCENVRIVLFHILLFAFIVRFDYKLRETINRDKNDKIKWRKKKNGMEEKKLKWPLSNCWFLPSIGLSHIDWLVMAVAVINRMRPNDKQVEKRSNSRQKHKQSSSSSCSFD